MKPVHSLTHFERKLITVIQHNNKKGRSPSLQELEMRLGYAVDEIDNTINDLIERKWINKGKEDLIVIRKLF